jgi:hypothetical protein
MKNFFKSCYNETCAFFSYIKEDQVKSFKKNPWLMGILNVANVVIIGAYFYFGGVVAGLAALAWNAIVFLGVYGWFYGSYRGHKAGGDFIKNNPELVKVALSA